MARKRKRPSPSRSSSDANATTDTRDGDGETSRAQWHAVRRATNALTRLSDMPTSLHKYWRQRHTLFSLFSAGILLDEQSWYSVTPEAIAARIAKRCAATTALDAFCGAGGNAIQLAMTCQHVVALDIDPNKIALAKHNAALYGVQDRITFITADFVHFAHAHPLPEYDVVFLSPPWGGVDYHKHTQSYDLAQLAPLPGTQLFALARTLSNNIAFYLPRNVRLDQVANLDPDNKVDVEYQYLAHKLSAITVYYGNLVTDWDPDTDDWRSSRSTPDPDPAHQEQDYISLVY